MPNDPDDPKELNLQDLTSKKPSNFQSSLISTEIIISFAFGIEDFPREQEPAHRYTLYSWQIRVYQCIRRSLYDWLFNVGVNTSWNSFLR